MEIISIEYKNVLVILYALSAVYFAGVMVRLMLTLTPVVCILSGIAFSGLLDLFLREDDTTRGEDSDGDDHSTPTGTGRLYDKVCSIIFEAVGHSGEICTKDFPLGRPFDNIRRFFLEIFFCLDRPDVLRK